MPNHQFWFFQPYFYNIHFNNKCVSIGYHTKELYEKTLSFYTSVCRSCFFDGK